MKTKKTMFCLSCHGPNAYIFSVPLRASAAWLKKALGRRTLIDGIPLSKSQVQTLRRRIIGFTQIGWCDSLEYFLESLTVSSPKKRGGEAESK